MMIQRLVLISCKTLFQSTFLFGYKIWNMEWSKTYEVFFRDSVKFCLFHKSWVKVKGTELG